MQASGLGALVSQMQVSWPFMHLPQCRPLGHHLLEQEASVCYLRSHHSSPRRGHLDEQFHVHLFRL